VGGNLDATETGIPKEWKGEIGGIDWISGNTEIFQEPHFTIGVFHKFGQFIKFPFLFTY